MNDLFQDREIKQILSLNEKSFYSEVEFVKLNVLRSVKKMFDEYPLLYGISIGAVSPEVKPTSTYGKKISNTLNPFSLGSPGHLAKMMASIMSNTTTKIIVDDFQLGGCVDFLAPGTVWELKIQKGIKEKDFYNYCKDALVREEGKVQTHQGSITHKEMKEHFKKEFSYLKSLDKESKKEFMNNFLRDSMGERIKKISIRNPEGNINQNFKDEVYDFLGDDLMKKINYNLLNNQLGEKPKTKLRKI